MCIFKAVKFIHILDPAASNCESRCDSVCRQSQLTDVTCLQNAVVSLLYHKILEETPLFSLQCPVATHLHCW